LQQNSVKRFNQDFVRGGAHFAPIHRQRAYRDAPHRCMDLQVTESVAARTLALPFFNQISSEQVDEVCSALRDALL